MEYIFIFFIFNEIAIREEYVQMCIVLKKTQHSQNTGQTLGEPWAVRLRELLSDFIEFFSSVQTSLALRSCSSDSNPIYYGMPLWENFSFKVHDFVFKKPGSEPTS